MTTTTTIGEMLGASMSAKDVRTHGSDTQHVPHTGGPAFPAQPTQRIAPGVTVESNNGMTLRDYFAARAPERIEEWFSYKHPTPRPDIPWPHEELDAEEQRQLDGLGDWIPGDQVSEKVKEFAVRYRAALDAGQAWDRECWRAKFCAWRYAYADAMLEARGAA
jgi:hypothetical protein